MSTSICVVGHDDWFRWELVRPLIRRIFLEERKSGKELVREMASKYNFYATEGQYDRHRTLWKMRKGLPEDMWKWVAQEIREIQQLGGRYEVILSGIQLSSSQVDRAISRHCFESTLDKLQGTFSGHIHKPPSDMSLSVRRPRRSVHYQSDQLPWFSLRNQLYEALAFRAADSRIRYSGYEEALSNALQSSFWALELPASTTRRDRALHRLTQLLDLYMPEMRAGENCARADYLQMPRTIVEKIEIFFFVLCNGLAGGHDGWDRAVVKVTAELKLLLQSSWLQKIVASHHEYRKVIVEAMFASAVRVGDLDLVSWLLTEGADPELPVQMTGFRSGICMDWISNYDTCNMTPIEVAFCKSDIDLASPFIAKGVMASRRLSSMSSAEIVVTEVGNSRSAQLRLLQLVLHEDKTLSVAQCLRALSLATRNESFDCARLLLEEIRLRDCKSACITELLRIAVIIGHDNIVDALLEEGANVNGNCCNIDLLEEAFSGTKCRSTIYPHLARSPIAAALLGGRSSIFRVLLNRGASPNGHLLNEPTPLQCAAYMDDTEAIGILDEFHANINQITERRMTEMGFFFISLERTALQVAIDADNRKATHALLERGAKLLGGELSMAIKNNFSAIYQTLLDLGASVNDTLPESNGSALEHAILNRNEPMVHRLLSSDQYTYCTGALCASVSIRQIGNLSQHGMVNAIMRNRKSPTHENLLLEGTALAIAMNRGDASLVSLLLSKDIRSTHCFYSRAWHGEKEGLFPERHSNWWRHPFGSMSVLASTVRANPGIVDLLLQSGYYVDEVAFCTAAQYSRRPVFEMVLSKAMETNHGLFPQAERAPLQCAISSGNMETIELLLRHGAKLDLAAPGFDTFTFSHVAEPTRLELIKLLLGAGIDARAQRSSFFRNALASALYKHDMEFVRLLLEAGADVNASSGSGHQSMLRMAVGAGALEAVEMILDRGGKVDYGSLEIAVRRGYFGVVEALLVACDHGHEFEDSEHPQAWAELASLSQRIGHLDLQQLLLQVSISVASFSQSRFPGDSRALYQTGRSTTTRPLQSNKPGQGPSVRHSEWNLNLKRGIPISSSQGWWLQRYHPGRRAGVTVRNNGGNHLH